MNVALSIRMSASSERMPLFKQENAFLPEEREWLQALLDWGLTDTYRVDHPDDTQSFSWFDYRSRGFEQDPQKRPQN